ncbi:MAG TPA: methionine adenosyltransferase [Planctomycetota bacterium]|jgi:S-adenosylmethionine synthetase|nr:methionine adenosyltransferase [Planctomycetota bacterium]
MGRDGKWFFTSEAVCMGHPDKMCDQISDAILDAILKDDPEARVACETLVKTGFVLVAGEITTKTYVEVPEVVRQTIKEIGYDSSEIGFDYHTCGILTSISQQSADIDEAVSADSERGKELGAGDQGIMFGYATNETETYMPLPIDLARRICLRAAEVRQSGELPWLRPDGKAQVTIEYEGARPVRVHTVVCSLQHSPNVTLKQIRAEVIERIVRPILPPGLVDKNVIYHINPSGRFVIGGPQGDCGMTGRKIIADTYGGMGHHGGGAFSGKDPTKVDRSASYAARHAAKNVVAAGLADRCEIQLAYAIGVAHPLAVFVDTFGTGKISSEKLEKIVQELFDFRPARIIDYYNLRRPIYKNTARYGHVGVDRPECTWEKLEKVEALRRAAGFRADSKKTARK